MSRLVRLLFLLPVVASVDNTCDEEGEETCALQVTARETWSCCRANTAECNACNARMTIADYCANPANAAVVGCVARPCCMAYNAECNACSAGITIAQYCPDNTNVPGCEAYAIPCQEGASVQCPESGEQCAGNQCCQGKVGAGTFPCPSASPSFKNCKRKNKVTDCLARACCRANTADCLSCAAGMSKEDYCNIAANQQVPGCSGGGACCLAHNADCNSCAAGVSKEEYCANPANQAVPGCGGGKVSCGGHFAPNCAACPGGNGREWCNGDCQWVSGKCVARSSVR